MPQGKMPLEWLCPMLLAYPASHCWPLCSYRNTKKAVRLHSQDAQRDRNKTAVQRIRPLNA